MYVLTENHQLLDWQTAFGHDGARWCCSKARGMLPRELGGKGVNQKLRRAKQGLSQESGIAPAALQALQQLHTGIARAPLFSVITRRLVR